PRSTRGNRVSVVVQTTCVRRLSGPLSHPSIRSCSGPLNAETSCTTNAPRIDACSSSGAADRFNVTVSPRYGFRRCRTESGQAGGPSRRTLWRLAQMLRHSAMDGILVLGSSEPSTSTRPVIIAIPPRPEPSHSICTTTPTALQRVLQSAAYRQSSEAAVQMCTADLQPWHVRIGLVTLAPGAEAGGLS